MDWLFIGPTTLAGIGQVTKRYSKLVQRGEYVEFGQRPQKNRYAMGFAFVLPIENQLTLVDQYATFCSKMIYMTICETETVNPAYGMLVDRYKTLYVASEFCKKVFEKQFPQGEWHVLHLHAPPPPTLRYNLEARPYIFYTIGNVADPRKNINALIRAISTFPEARLLIKATCNQPVAVDHPQVTIINGLISDEQMENVHAKGHCYVNCSHSEGVGMGAVEAALRSKPVIITDYGGLKEYVKTPFMVPCKLGPIGFDDFLFTKDLVWGHPSYDELVRHMGACYEQRIMAWDHSHTSGLLAAVPEALSSIQ
jgi:glycosyltransferase involved in cell wall biosynthesis